jgi:hypothetical protein
VPEAPVDEDGDLGTREDDVGPPGEVRQRAPVDAVAQPAPVEEVSERQVGSGVASGEGAHLLADRLG